MTLFISEFFILTCFAISIVGIVRPPKYIYEQMAAIAFVLGTLLVWMIYRALRNASETPPPDIYIELEATAPKYWTLRMFSSEWMIKNELSRKLRWVERPLTNTTPSKEIIIKEDANYVV